MLKSNKYAIYTQETDYSSTIIPTDKELYKIAIYYRLLIYSNSVLGSNVLGEFCIFNGGWNYLFSTSSDTTKYHHIFRQLKVVQKLVGLGRIQGFMLILGRVG